MKKILESLAVIAQAAIKKRAVDTLSGGALLLSSAMVGAHADAPHTVGIAPLPAYTQECASCHMAYPPAFLPAASWQRLMGNLGKHFGVDASLDTASNRAIASWLKDNAGTYKRVKEEPPQDRISQSDWFLRKHREGEVPANVWKRPAVGSPSRCEACHTTADRGDFDEHKVRIPK